MVSIDAFQALDPGSIPGHRRFYFLKIIKCFSNEKRCSATGNRTPVSRVTGGDTHHYTIVELFFNAFKINFI